MKPSEAGAIPRAHGWALALWVLAALGACPPPPGPRARPARAAAPLEVEHLPSPLLAGHLFSLAGEQAHLLFHLNLRNTGKRETRLRRIVLASHREGRVLSQLVLEERALVQRLRAVPFIVMRDQQTIAAAHRYRGTLARPKGDTRIPAGEAISLTYQHTILGPELLPDRIHCLIEHDGGPTTHAISVGRYRQRTPLRLPVAGKWWVMEGHRFDEDHASALVGSQIFAYDLGVLGSSLTTYQGDPRLNASYLAHDQAVLAAADGVVVATHDGVPENEPVGARPTWTQIMRSPRDLAGNFVVLRHLGNEHTAYLHLRPGLRVRPGTTVRAGEAIGRCGNSGNSLESHLHFQLQDGPDPLRANGLPPRFSDFTILFAHLRLHVPAARSLPLPGWLVVQPGTVEGAREFPVRPWR